MKLIIENWNKFINEEERGAELVFFDDKINSKENQEKGLSLGTGGILLSLRSDPELARKALEIIKEGTNFIVKISDTDLLGYKPGEIASITTQDNVKSAMSTLSGMGTTYESGYVKPERIMAEVLNQIKGIIPATIKYNDDIISN